MKLSTVQACLSPSAPLVLSQAHELTTSPGGAARANNILQHGLLWMKEPRFRETLHETGRVMLDRLVKMQESAGEEIKYSLKG